ncbi:hypothetical protein UK82_26505 [Frankia sp. ACN1ag]|nr:hypothetical protein UK82_26505 [Frankia sp. ACN1ag]
MGSVGGIVTNRDPSSPRHDAWRSDPVLESDSVLESDPVLESDLVLEIVGCLESTADLLSPATRDLLVRRFERRAGRRLFVPQFDVARDWCFRFVESCVELDNGAEILVDAVSDLRPDSAVAHRLAHILAEQGAAEVAEGAGELWDLLRRELSALPAQRVAHAFRHACHPAQPPRHCTTAWQLFLWVANRHPEPARLPQHAVFLIRCADVLAPGTFVRVEAWLRGEAHRRDLTHQMQLAQLAAAPVPRRRTGIVSLQFQPVGPRSEDHLASWWLHWADAATPHQGGARPARPELFEQIAAAVVEDAEEILGAEIPTGESAELVVEIFLPFAYMDLPVTSWRRQIHGTPRLLVEDHPVVVRSFERLHRRGSRFLWLQRWAALTAPDPSGMVVADAARVGRHGLAKDERIAAVTLSGPPTQGSPAQRQLAEALSAGLAVAAWQVDDPDRPHTDRPLLELLAHGDPFRLPQRFRRENLTRLEPRGDRHAPGPTACDAQAAARRTAILLWDDPRRAAWRAIAGSARLPRRPTQLGQATPSAGTQPEGPA